MKLLHLDSSILGPNSASREVGADLVSRWRASVPGLRVTHRDLAVTPVPHLTGASLAQADAEETALATEVLEEFLAADVIVMGVPMYNFGIPSQLKAWLDRVAVAGKTFRYTAEGPEGLAGGKKVIVSAAYGGFHASDSASNFVEPYLRAVLGFMGITDVEFVTAEGLSVSPEQRKKGLADAHAKAATLSPLQQAA